MQTQLLGFYTDQQGRVRPITQRQPRGKRMISKMRLSAQQAVLTKYAKPEVPYLLDEPFTADQVQYYNMFSHFNVDINREFKAYAQAAEQEARSKLAVFGIYTLPEDVSHALLRYRQALYNYFLDKGLARATAPPISVVGASGYKGNVDKARRIEERAIERLDAAKRHLDSTVMRHVAGKKRVSEQQAIERSRLAVSDLRRLKRDLGLKNQIKSYDYKHKDGTGVANIVLIKDQWDRWNLRYEYDLQTGKVYSASFGKVGSALSSFSADSYEQLISHVKSVMAGGSK